MFKKHMINLVRLIKRYLPDSLVAFAGGIGLLPSRRHSSICSPEFDQAINECIVWLSALLHPFEFSLIVKCEEGISFLIIEKNPFDGTGIFVSKHCYWGVQPCCCLSIKEERVFSILFFSYFCDPCSQKCICWLGLKLNCFDERVRHRLLRLTYKLYLMMLKANRPNWFYKNTGQNIDTVPNGHDLSFTMASSSSLSIE